MLITNQNCTYSISQGVGFNGSHVPNEGASLADILLKFFQHDSFACFASIFK